MSGTFERDDRVLKRRLFGIIRDRFDFFQLLAHAGVHRGREMFVFDLVERRVVKRQRAFGEQRIVGGSGGGHGGDLRAEEKNARDEIVEVSHRSFDLSENIQRSTSNIQRLMKKLVVLIFSLLPVLAIAAEEKGWTFYVDAGERFATLALACVHKEYPNKISHVLNSDADVAPPRKLTPAFCGCYDWHSSVHGHWLLVRLIRTFPDAPFASAARDALKQSLTAENLKQEAAYIKGEGRSSFERPYGLSWLLQCCAELREWDDPQAREMSANLRPLEETAVERLKTWLPKLSHPVRIGEHDQTAFGLGLMLDYARTAGNEEFAKLGSDSAKKFFLADKNCPLAYEPSGEDFLSPSLGEADVMRRVLPQNEFATWLKQFMPQIPVGRDETQSA